MSGTGNFLLDQVLGAMKVSPEQIKATVAGAEARLVSLETNVAAVLTGISDLTGKLEKVLSALENEAPVVEKAVRDAIVTRPVETAPAPVAETAPEPVAEVAPEPVAEAATAKAE